MRWLSTQRKTRRSQKKLKPESRESSLSDTVWLINGFLSTIINHSNSLFIDIDFSENSKITVKFKPQSLHWYYEVITVLSGIVKLHTEKNLYHLYVSDNKKQTKISKKYPQWVLEIMENIPESCIKSDNCSLQYKTVQHFKDIKNICNKIYVPIMCLLSVVGHGTGLMPLIVSFLNLINVDDHGFST